MEDNKGRRAVVMTASLLLAAILVSACQQTGGDPFQAGQVFRDQVDIVLADTGRFIAGFCSSAALPGLAAVVVTWFASSRRGM